MNYTYNRILDVIASHTGVSQAKIKVRSKFQEFYQDSLDVMDLRLGLEMEFDLELTDLEFDEIKTVGDAVQLFDNKLHEKHLSLKRIL